MVVMSDAWLRFLAKENKPYWRRKGIRFGVQCLVWHSILHSNFFFTLFLTITSYCSNEGDKIRQGRENVWNMEVFRIWRLELLEVTYEILISNFHGAKEINWMKKCSNYGKSNYRESTVKLISEQLSELAALEIHVTWRMQYFIWYCLNKTVWQLNNFDICTLNAIRKKLV